MYFDIYIEWGLIKNFTETVEEQMFVVSWRRELPAIPLHILIQEDIKLSNSLTFLCLMCI